MEGGFGSVRPVGAERGSERVRLRRGALGLGALGVFRFISALGPCLPPEDGFVSPQCCFSFLGTPFVTR